MDSFRGYSCKCKVGFTGSRCKVDIDDCEKNQLCLNDGTCVDGVNGISCRCLTGFAGDRYV